MKKAVFIAVFAIAAVCTSCNDDRPLREFKVRFESNSDSSVAEQTVKEGEKLIKPQDPTREGYIFAGWFKEASFDTEWEFDTDVVTNNITLHAKWNENNLCDECGEEDCVCDAHGDKCEVCGKEDCVCDDGAIHLLESIYKNGKLSSKYEYDEKNRITEITSYFYDIDETLLNTTIKKFSYNNVSDLTSILIEYPSNPENNNSTIYQKNGNKIIWRKDNANYAVNLNSKGFPEKQTIEFTIVEFNHSTMSTYSYFVRETHTYLYTNDNVSTITFVMSTGSTSANVSTIYTSTQTYTYDNKKSPFYHCKTPKWIMVLDGRSTKNNILTEIRHHHDYDFGLFTTIYTYDSEGFPSEGTITFILENYGHQEGEYVVEYKYKNIE